MAASSLRIGEQAKRRLRFIMLDVIRRGMKDQRALRVLEQQLVQDPLGTLERINKLLPDDPKPEAAGPAMSFNLQFLSAVREASAPTPAIEAEPLKVIEHRETEW
jgi:hypothetical protein